MEYLSEAWLEAATEALADTTAGEISLRVGYDVTDGPDHRRAAYTLVMAEDSLSFVSGLVEPDATLELSYDLAVAIAQNQVSAQRAFLDGNIRLGGDITSLLGSANVLAAIDDRLRSLREATIFTKG